MMEITIVQRSTSRDGLSFLAMDKCTRNLLKEQLVTTEGLSE